MTATQDLRDHLPEFPLETFEALGPLERSDHGPFLTIKPPRVEASRPPPVPQGTSKSSFVRRHHFVWVSYPRVICHYPGDLADGLQIAPATLGESGSDHPTGDLTVLAQRVRHYRLSSLQERKFVDPMWCTVTYGPRAGKLVETESCIDGEANRWEFSIPDTPEVGAVWYGTASDMPAVPSLTVFWGTMSLAKTDDPECCPGYDWCAPAEGCRDASLPCNDPILE
jgi:hypothetical protein